MGMAKLPELSVKGHDYESDVYDVSEAKVGAIYGFQRKPSNWRKSVVIGTVIGVVVCVLIVTAIGIGLKFFFNTDETVKQTYEFRVNGMNKMTEDVVINNDAENVIANRVTSDDEDIWTIDDLNRQLSTWKTKLSSGADVCYISPLNRSESSSFEQQNEKGQEQGAVRAKIERNFVLSPDPISDHSIMGQAGQRLCAGTSVYWRIPIGITEPQQSNAVAAQRRRKRESCCRYCQYTYCCQSCSIIV